MSVAHNSRLVADGFAEGLTQGDTDVLHSVVGIDMQIAPGLHPEIEKAMPGYLIEHVLKKGQTGGKVPLATSIEMEVHPDRGFGGLTVHVSLAHTAMIRPAQGCPAGGDTLRPPRSGSSP